MAAITQYGVILYLDRQASLAKVAKTRTTKAAKLRKLSGSSTKQQSLAWSSSSLASAAASAAADLTRSSSIEETIDQRSSSETPDADIKLRLQQIDRWSFVLFPTVSFIIAVTYWVYFLNKRCV